MSFRRYKLCLPFLSTSRRLRLCSFGTWAVITSNVFLHLLSPFNTITSTSDHTKQGERVEPSLRVEGDKIARLREDFTEVSGI